MSEMFKLGFNHSNLLQDIFLVNLDRNRIRIGIPSVRHKKSECALMQLDGPVELFQLKLFIPSLVGSMEGLNIPKA